MGHVLIALVPVSVWGIVLYGLPALRLILVSVAASVGSEALFRRIVGRENRSGNLSAAVSGLLLALVLPPSTPWWMAALGAVFAMVVVKEFFGGLGANVFNPALAGRAFLLMSFPAAITSWPLPRGAKEISDTVKAAEALSGATPLGITALGGSVADVGREFAAFGLAPAPDYWQTMRTLFIGNHSGTIGESSILLILAGCLYLLVTGVIDWRAPLTMAGSALGLSFLLRMAGSALGIPALLHMDPLFSVLAGGLCFGAAFMATDYTTTPSTAAGRLLFGAGAGIITVLIRVWGNYPEGVTFGILIMNALSPFLNRLIQKKYGFVKKSKPAAGGKGGTAGSPQPAKGAAL
jgi:electron transport complex protein RnfD